MDLVLLAGGQGTRLRPLTYTTPKPLLPLMGEPLLERLLRPFEGHAARALLTASSLREAMVAWAGSWNARTRAPPVRVVEEPEPLGTGGALRNALAVAAGPRLAALNADVLCDVDAGALLAFHDRAARAGALATVALTDVENPSAYGVADVEGDRIRRFVEKPPHGRAPSNLVNAGLYVFERAALERLPAGRSSVERDLFPLLAAEGALAAYPLAGAWSDLGTPDRYLAAHAALLLRARTPRRVGEGSDVDRAARVETSVLGAACRVEAGGRVTGSVLFDGVRVGPRATVERSILGRGVAVGEGAVVADAVVGDGVAVRPRSTVRGERLGLRPGDTYL